EFNVNDDQRVYFFNSIGIESILGRVTGDSPSEIFGTLGVDGPADLFLINPNGLVFGETAIVDVMGSFYGTTAEAVAIGDSLFSAVAPDQSQLLSVSPDISFWNYLTEASGDVVNRGVLAIGGDLILSGNSLDLQGQVAALGDVSLLATDTVQIRDTAEVPFIGFAGGNLLVQGNQQVDIVALSHPESGLFANGDMVLRSAGPVGGDTHYLSGGDFRVEQLDGTDGELFSPIDPIIRALGDVTIGTYEGSSLHILAGGSVSIGTAEIISLEGTEVGIDFLQETIILSDGTIVEIDGNAQPTLDVRAGVRPDALGTPPLELLTGFNSLLDAFSLDSDATQVATSADITIGDALLRVVNGVVLLTNQYEPNLELSGGDIVVTGDGNIGVGIDATNSSGLGGAVYLDARNNVEVLNSSIDTTAVEDVKDVVIVADETVTFDGLNGTRFAGAISFLVDNSVDESGNVRITARNLQVLGGAQLNTGVLGSGNAGDVILVIEETAQFEGSNPIDGFSSGAFSLIPSDTTGEGGDVRIMARNLEVLGGAELGTSLQGNGSAGSIILDVEETVRFEGIDPVDGLASGAFSSVDSGAIGTAGDVRITARNLEVLEGAQLSASVFGEGNAGNVILDVEETVRFESVNPIDGNLNGAFSTVGPGSIGTGGDVRITARNLEVLEGAQLSSGTFGEGNAGNVILAIEETTRFEGGNPITGTPTGAFSSVEPTGIGTGGDVRITTRNLEVLEGAQIGANTFGQGNAGNVILELGETARFDGVSLVTEASSAVGSSVQPGAVGRGGNVEITARDLEVTNGAQLNAATFGEGNAGNIILVIEETARVAGMNAVNESASIAGSSVQPGGVGQGGDVEVTARNLEVADGALISAETFGEGDAGNVILNVEETVRLDGMTSILGSIPAGVRSSVAPGGIGRGGDIEINTRNLDVLNGAQISVETFGEGDAGTIRLNVEETARLDGENLDGFNSTVASSVSLDAMGRGGDIEVTARNLEVTNGSRIDASTLGEGDAGDILLNVEDTILFDGLNATTGLTTTTFVGSFVIPGAIGNGGDIEVMATNLELVNRSGFLTVSDGEGNAGDIALTIRDRIQLQDGTIATNAEFNAGGQIQIEADSIVMFGNSDIQTFVNSGDDNGGNITINANALVAFDDSDILAFAADGRGGDIDLGQTAFLGQDFFFAPPGTDPRTLEGNDRVDINATGRLASGTISLVDVSFIQDSLIELPDNLVNSEALVANSCIARSRDTDSNLVITGSDGLPVQPEHLQSSYELGEIRSFTESSLIDNDDSVTEPQDIYRLADGRIVLGRECELDRE
nr:filamentous hemagglutinin N-terminal domain-containing protein [Leptolyngbyaceae cyanobacterium MAG.088]